MVFVTLPKHEVFDILVQKIKRAMLCVMCVPEGQCQRFTPQLRALPVEEVTWLTRCVPSGQIPAPSGLSMLLQMEDSSHPQGR